MMLKPDDYFNSFLLLEIERKHQRKAQVSFRRAIREYYVLQRRYVIDPATFKRVQRIQYGEAIRQQKNQRRRVSQFFTGRNVGRSQKYEIQILMSRLFVLWGRFAKTKPTFSWKSKLTTSTDFEYFLFDLLPKLGIKNVRRHAETHWSEREKVQQIWVK